MFNLAWPTRSLALVIALAVAGCAPTPTAASPAPSSAAPATATNAAATYHHGTTIDGIRTKGVITIGVASDPPWSYTTPTGAPGLVPLVIAEFAKREGIGKVETVSLVLANYIGAIDSYRIDMLGDTLYKTPAREAVVDYAQPLWYNPDTLMVQPGNPKNMHQQTDFKGGVKICASEGSSQIDQMKALIANGQQFTIVPVPDNATCLNALSAGQVDGTLFDAVTAQLAKQKNPSLKYDIVLDYRPPNLDRVIAYTIFHKGATDLIQAWNDRFDEMSKDGTIDRLFKAADLDAGSFVVNKLDPMFKPR